jgi:hypothetical protein
MMRHNGDSWLISDIYLDGAISEVAIRRSEFACFRIRLTAGGSRIRTLGPST